MISNDGMKRIVYSPKVNVFVQGDSGVFDLSPYVTDCSVNRKINAVSTATVSFRNPNKMFTNGKDGPIFHPMDPIVITMSRLPNRPVQVFTGYCDSTPYFQLKPGVATISASCTLKKLLHTYWDPGLPFVTKMLTQRGWSTTTGPGGDVALQNAQAATLTGDQITDRRADGNDANAEDAIPVTDGSIGALLYDVLLYVGNWHPDTIYIENIPPTLYETAESLLGDINEANKESVQAFKRLMKQIIGQDSQGGGSPLGNTGGAGPEPFATVTPVDVGRAMLTAGFPNDESIIAEGINVVKGESDFGNYEPWKELNEAGCVGYWQHQIAPPDGDWAGHDISLEDACTLVPSTTLTKQMWQDSGNSFYNHWYKWNGGGYSKDTSTYLPQAKSAIQLGKFTSPNQNSTPTGAGGPSGPTGSAGPQGPITPGSNRG
jgi:hypothetical protein